jgi:antitoxin MazE7
MSDTTIKVDSAVRDRLAVLAAQRGSTIRDLVSRLAAATPTREEQAARHAAAVAYVRARLSPELSEADLAAGERFWRGLEGGQIPASLDSAASAEGQVG